jgi:hypothetical protein
MQAISRVLQTGFLLDLLVTLKMEVPCSSKLSVAISRVLQTGFLLDLLVTLKMEVPCSSKLSVDFQQTTWYYIPDDQTLRNLLCEKLISYIWERDGWYMYSVSSLLFYFEVAFISFHHSCLHYLNVISEEVIILSSNYLENHKTFSKFIKRKMHVPVFAGTSAQNIFHCSNWVTLDTCTEMHVVFI